jgi:DNA anti-recombination protein RmuC
VARPIRDMAVRKLDNAMSPRFVRQDDMEHAIDELGRTVSDELSRTLSDRFDAEAEAITVLGQRLEALTLLVERMQEELLELRSRR